MINPTDKNRLDAIEQKLNELMRRIAELERKVSAMERTPQADRQAVQPAVQRPASPVTVEHNYLRRAIAAAKRDHDKKYK